MSVVYIPVASHATSKTAKFAQSATNLVPGQGLHWGHDHQAPRGRATDVAAHVGLLAVEVDAIARLHHEGFSADDEFNGAFQEEKHFLAIMLDELGMHFLARRKRQLERAHLLVGEVTAGQVVRIAVRGEGSLLAAILGSRQDVRRSGWRFRIPEKVAQRYAQCR